MNYRFKIKLSTPKDKNLSKRQLQLLNELLQLIEAAQVGVIVGLVGERLDKQFSRIKRCQGVLLVAFSQWKGSRLVRDQAKNCIFPSEYAHMSNVMAVATNRPLLVIREKNVAERGTLKPEFIQTKIDLPVDVEPNWLQTPVFRRPFDEWLKKLKSNIRYFLAIRVKQQKQQLK